MPTVERLHFQVPDNYLAELWNPGGKNSIIKQNITIGYVKECYYKEKDPMEQLKISGKIIQIQPSKTMTVAVGSHRNFT